MIEDEVLREALERAAQSANLRQTKSRDVTVTEIKSREYADVINALRNLSRQQTKCIDTLRFEESRLCNAVTTLETKTTQWREENRLLEAQIRQGRADVTRSSSYRREVRTAVTHAVGTAYRSSLVATDAKLQTEALLRKRAAARREASAARRQTRVVEHLLSQLQGRVSNVNLTTATALTQIDSEAVL